MTDRVEILMLAPQLEYPPQRGGNIYIERVARYLSVRRGKVIILGAHALVHYENGAPVHQESYTNSLRSKILSGIRTIVLRSHYLVEKLLTREYRQKAAELIGAHSDSVILCSNIAAAHLPIALQATNPLVIFTQNDEIAWWDNHSRFSKNPLHKAIAHISRQWVKKFITETSAKALLVHITEADRKGYDQIVPGHHSLLVPPGVDIFPLPQVQEWNGIISLLFCGSLSVKMNYDALVFFKEKFWTVLNKDLDGKLELWVAGSRPTPAVQQFCKAQGWKLFADLPDEALRDLHWKATLSILPFPYTTGAKIKLLNSLAAGLPVMATTNMRYTPDQDFFPNLYSDEVSVWSNHLVKFTQSGVPIEDRLNCQRSVLAYGWQAIADRFDDDLRKIGS